MTNASFERKTLILEKGEIIGVLGKKRLMRSWQRNKCLWGRGDLYDSGDGEDMLFWECGDLCDCGKWETNEVVRVMRLISL